jgi:Tfp pilus assembly protein PilW
MSARTGSMSRTSAHSPEGRAGFTLVELIVGVSLAFIVMAGILAAYLFLGRNLTRMVNLQQQEVKNRRVLQQFTTDVSSAIQFTTATDTQIVLSVQTAGSPATVTYTYAVGAGSTGTLARMDAAGTMTLLTGLSSFDFNFYTETGASTTNLPSIKSAEFSYTSSLGTATTGTQASYTTVSARVLLRNKPALL